MSFDTSEGRERFYVSKLCCFVLFGFCYVLLSLFSEHCVHTLCLPSFLPFFRLYSWGFLHEILSIPCLMILIALHY